MYEHMSTLSRFLFFEKEPNSYCLGKATTLCVSYVRSGLNRISWKDLLHFAEILYCMKFIILVETCIESGL
jgi:hypothetical protein